MLSPGGVAVRRRWRVRSTRRPRIPREDLRRVHRPHQAHRPRPTRTAAGRLARRLGHPPVQPRCTRTPAGSPRTGMTGRLEPSHWRSHPCSRSTPAGRSISIRSPLPYGENWPQATNQHEPARGRTRDDRGNRTGKLSAADRTALSAADADVGYQPDWLVDDVDDAVELLASHGVGVVAAPFKIPVGRAAVIRDLSQHTLASDHHGRSPPAHQATGAAPTAAAAPAESHRSA